MKFSLVYLEVSSVLSLEFSVSVFLRVVFKQPVLILYLSKGMVAVVSISAPAFLIIMVPLLFVYKKIQTYYLATSRELKRLDATTKSPIFASFQETLGGVATIRAYRQNSRFIAENEARVDRNQEAFFPSINTNRWLAVRLEVSAIDQTAIAQ